MEKKKILQLLIPAVAAAALLALVLFIALGQNEEDQHSHAKGPDGKPLKSGVIPESQRAKDMSSKDLSTEMPSLTAPEFKDIGNGLKIMDVIIGEGDTVPTGATVTAHYRGWLAQDGRKFDSSYADSRSGGAPTTFPLTNVVEGWQVGLPGMKPGGVRRLIIPSKMGYGKQGRPPQIPSDATLVFEVKMCEWK